MKHALEGPIAKRNKYTEKMPAGHGVKHHGGHHKKHHKGHHKKGHKHHHHMYGV